MQADKSTLRQHLSLVERATRRQVPQLHRAPPPALAYLWAWFRKLSATRSYDEEGAQLISSVEVLAWAQGMQIALRRAEFELLREMDAAVVRFSRGKL